MKNLNKTKVVVGVSGGVDSAVALELIKQKGYIPIALHLQIPIWNEYKNKFEINKKQNEQNIKIIKEICTKLNVEYKFIDTSKNFEQKVISYFKKEYQKYRTPNPCTFCNKNFKFKQLIDFANKNDVFYIATGHYAQIKYSQKEKDYKLLKAKDTNKDQTYGLCLLKQEELKRIKFPLGKYTKPEIYKIANNLNFNIFKKEKQSQDICFLKNNNIKEYLKKNINFKQGYIIDEKNKILGEHKGLCFYTIGQRKGLELNKLSYVKSIDSKNNKLIITNNKKEINASEIELVNYSFTTKTPISKEIEVKCKTRYQQIEKPCKLIIEPKKIKVKFDNPQDLVAIGQYCVFYKNKECLGGGVINNYK